MTQLISLIEKGKEVCGSYQGLADRMGVPQTHISMWKSGKRTCTPKKRAQLAEITGGDTTSEFLEGLAETLDPADPIELKARKALLAAIKKL